MSYYVYENWTRDRGRIHKAECGYCNYGQGIHARDSGKNGRWLPPFEQREEAIKAAAALGHSDMRPCSACNP